MNKAEILRNLRQQTLSPEAFQKEFWKAPLLEAGVAKGTVVELMGNARTEWLLQLLTLHPEPFVFWCERDVRANPTAIYQRGIELRRIKFVTSKDLAQPLRMALESGHYPFIIAPNLFEEVRVFQRFQLLAEKTKSTLFLLAQSQFSNAWPIAQQLRIDFTDNGMNVEIEKQKHGSGS